MVEKGKKAKEKIRARTRVWLVFIDQGSKEPGYTSLNLVITGRQKDIS